MNSSRAKPHVGAPGTAFDAIAVPGSEDERGVLQRVEAQQVASLLTVLLQPV